MQKNIFNVNIIEKNDVSIIYLNGYLDAHSAPNLEEEVNNLISHNKFKLIFEFSNLEYISSAGLGVFMTFIENVRENNGDIKLTNMVDKVKTVFELLGFNMLFEITNSVDEAISNFNKQ